MRRNRISGLGAALAVLAAVLCARAAEEKPAPPVVVEAGFAEAYPRMNVHFQGPQLSTDGRHAETIQRDWKEPVFPDPGQPLLFAVAATANGGDRRVKVTGSVADYLGRELAKVDFELPVKAGETGRQEVRIQPQEKDAGPFYFTGQWTETSGAGNGAIAIAAGLPNARLVVQDFETVRYTKPGQPVLSAAEARHGGRMGVLLKPQPPESGKGNAAAAKEPAVARYSLPLSFPLPGRPVRIGLWANATAATKLTLRLRDPGVEISQSVQPDRWAIGPAEVTGGAWQYVVFPAPDYGKPKAQVKSSCEGAVLDYPLSADVLDVECPPQTTVMVDDIDVWTQTEPESAARIRLVLDKPAGLLYRNDSLRLALANGWLWGQPRSVQYAAALTDIAGRTWPLAEGAQSLAPGAETVVEATLTNLPLGSYGFKAEMKSAGAPGSTLERDRPLMVYEPTGKPPADLAGLCTILESRDRVFADLGYLQDELLIPWHSVDGGPAVENPQGLFHYEWIDPEVKRRLDAGLEVIGQLGFTALWADPNTTYYPNTGIWMGNVYTLPSQSIYWEEYVTRTVEHYASQIKTWVVWERPDSAGFNATPAEFTEQILAVARAAAKRANPAVKLVSGGIMRENLEKYLAGLIRSRAGKYVDAVGIMPSTAPLAPEDGYMDVILARAQRLRVREHFDPPLWALGLGWQTGDGEGRISEDDQARYVARAYAICRANGVEKVLLEPYQVPLRDAAGFLFQDGGFFGFKPGALAGKTAAALLADSVPVREAFLIDRRDGLARAYLFRKPDGHLILCAWRLEGQSRLRLPIAPEEVLDVFGNREPLDPNAPAMTLHGAPHYLVFKAGDADALLKQIERSPLDYEDAPESGWKRAWTFYLDVGDAADEKAAQYTCTESRIAGPVSSCYHNDYGRYVSDTGRHFKGEEAFAVDVSAYTNADLLLRKRIDYSVPNQLVKVFCNGQPVGQWFAFKRDRRYHWRDIEFVVPNRFFAGQKTAALRFVAQNGEATSYAYWAAPLKQKTLYVSDLSLLVGTSGYGPGVNRDKNILGGPLRFFKGDGKPHAKGLGTNSAETMDDSLVVLMLNKQYKRLRGVVGVDAAANGRGSVRFRVGDGNRQLFDSKDMTCFSEPASLDVDVSDCILLLLTTDDSGDGRQNDIADWTDLQLELK